jgi:hypothetical protein
MAIKVRGFKAKWTLLKKVISFSDERLNPKNTCMSDHEALGRHVGSPFMQKIEPVGKAA